MSGPKLFLMPHICEIFFFYCHVIFFHSRSRSRVFLGMIASDSHSRIVGMDFFHSLPVPEFWEWIFFIPFPFPNFGNRFFHSLPIPEFWEWFFLFPSHSRIEGMVFFNCLPVPELREWNYPFLFPNSQLSFPLTLGLAQRFCWLMILMLFAFHNFFLLDSVVGCCILFVGSLLAGFRSQSCLVG